jgi:hypothetical protein
LSELSAGSCPKSSTPPLPSTSHLKNMRFLCSTLYIRSAIRKYILSNYELFYFVNYHILDVSKNTPSKCTLCI